MTAAGHDLRHSLSIHCRGRKLSAGLGQPIPAHYARIQPVDLSSSARAAKDADIRPVDLGHCVRNEELLQSKSVGHFNFNNFVPSHHSTPITLIHESINARVSPTCKQILVTFQLGKTATARTGSTSA